MSWNNPSTDIDENRELTVPNIIPVLQLLLYTTSQRSYGLPTWLDRAWSRNIYTFLSRKRFLLPVTYFHDPDQEYIYFMGPTRLVILIKYIYFMGSQTLPSACYILSDDTLPSACYILFDELPSTCYILFDESRIPFYSTSNRYKLSVEHHIYYTRW